jgi:hypothetical protein
VTFHTLLQPAINGITAVLVILLCDVIEGRAQTALDVREATVKRSDGTVRILEKNHSFLPAASGRASAMEAKTLIAKVIANRR